MTTDDLNIWIAENFLGYETRRSKNLITFNVDGIWLSLGLLDIWGNLWEQVEDKLAELGWGVHSDSNSTYIQKHSDKSKEGTFYGSHFYVIINHILEHKKHIGAGETRAEARQEAFEAALPEIKKRLENEIS